MEERGGEKVGDQINDYEGLPCTVHIDEKKLACSPETNIYYWGTKHNVVRGHTRSGLSLVIVHPSQVLLGMSKWILFSLN